MKLGQALTTGAALLCMAGLAAGRARSEPALPSWNEGDQEMLETGMLVPGSVLLGTETVNPETFFGQGVLAPKQAKGTL